MAASVVPIASVAGVLGCLARQKHRKQWEENQKTDLKHYVIKKRELFILVCSCHDSSNCFSANRFLASERSVVGASQLIGISYF